MSYNVYSTLTFQKSAKRITKKHPSIVTDLRKLIEEISSNPFCGIPLGNDSYKIRSAITSKGKGKSGGARVITWLKVVAQNVYLIAVYDKSEKETLTEQELSSLLVKSGL